MEKIREIISQENPDLLVLLGDIIVRREADYKKFLDELNYNKTIIYIKGDEDVINGDTDILSLIENIFSFMETSISTKELNIDLRRY